MSLILSGTNGLSDVDGSAATPAIRGTDTNTGIFFPAADTIAFAEGGVEAMRLDSSGNMGLGVTPSAWSSSGNLQIKGSGLDGGIASANQYLVIGANGYYNAGWKYITTGSATLYQQSAGQHQWYSAGSGSAGGAISYTQAMTLSASGQLGLVGATSPTNSIDIQGTAGTPNVGITINNNSGGSYGGLTLTRGGTAQTYLSCGGIDGYINAYGGDLSIGTTSTADGSGTGFKIKKIAGAGGQVTCTVDSSGGISTYHFYNINATNNGYRFYVNVNGGISNYSGNNINLSDERTKTNIELAGSYLSKVCAIPVKLFNYKDEAEGEQRTLGVIAQDVESVAPELVNQDGWLGEAPEGEEPLKSIYTTDLMFALMKSIQEQQAIITQLQADVAALKAKA